MAVAMPWPCWVPPSSVRRTIRSSVPCRRATRSRGGSDFRVVILPESTVVQVECQHDDCLPEVSSSVWREWRRGTLRRHSNMRDALSTTPCCYDERCHACRTADELDFRKWGPFGVHFIEKAQTAALSAAVRIRNQVSRNNLPK